MISEGSCDTEDWNKGITGIHNIFKALYGIVHPKNENSEIIYSFTKEDILKMVSN